MPILIESAGHQTQDIALRTMFEARKTVFVDLLKWDVPVLADRFEMDQYDDDHAIYLIVTTPEGQHMGSARLLPTTRPHILSTLFPQLCAGPVPRGTSIMEITRFCLSRDLRAIERRQVRDRLILGLARFALERGISAYTGVAEEGWLRQILAFGWRCRPLGHPMMVGSAMLGALRIDIDAQTPALLEAGGLRDTAALPTRLRHAV